MCTQRSFWLLMALIGALLSSCTAATPSPTPLPPVEPTALPPPALPTSSSPGNKGPAVKNYSLVTGTVVSVAPETDNGAIFRLTLNVSSTTHVENFPSFTDDKVGQQMVILFDPNLIGTAAAGNTVQIRVTYRGDEHGGNFYGTEIIVQP